MVTEQEKRENQQKILEWIKNDFNLSISSDRKFDNPVDAEQILSGSDYIVDFNQIFQAICDYVKTHPNDFCLDEFVHSNLEGGEIGGGNKRP
jgi:uncharacterized protein YlxP (DUF503 family)